MESYIYIDGWKTDLHFSSAHIIPEYDKCGRLHGHTYAVHAKVVGKLDSKGIILDFSILKNYLKKIINELDHKILIPDESKSIQIKKYKERVNIEAVGKSYVFPLNDCVFLPIDSTSAENLSKYILTRFIKMISIIENIELIEIGVDEGFGQGARISKSFN